MRVLFVQQQPCVRALKLAAGLRAVYPELRLAFAYQGLTLSEWYGGGDELFERWWPLDGEPRAAIARAVAAFRPDIVHSHNLPDTLTVAALDAGDGSVPVVHDVHDLQSLRQTAYENGFPQPDDAEALEKRAVEGADAVVAVSDELLAAIAARHRLPARALALPNYALRRDVPETIPPPERPANRSPRVVYQGTLSTNGGHYDLRRIFLELSGAGLQLDVYPGRHVAGYATLDGVRYRETLPAAQLLRTLPGYDYGWAGFDARLNAAHLDTALPNKLFEYLGCGVPVLTLGHAALRRFVSEHGVGLSVDRVADLATALESLDMPALRARVAELRPRLTVEANVHRLAELYDSLV